MKLSEWRERGKNEKNGRKRGWVVRGKEGWKASGKGRKREKEKEKDRWQEEGGKEIQIARKESGKDERRRK